VAFDTGPVPAVTEGTPTLRRGVRLGPQSTYVQQELSSPHVQLLLCGPIASWDATRVAEIAMHFASVLQVSYPTSEEADGELVDVAQEALTRLGVEDTAQYVIRPVGHVGFRCAGTDFDGAREYLERWFMRARNP
jgi:hypothetical protein